MKPTRIFVIRNLTTALFIAAYFKQRDFFKEKGHNICVLNWNNDLRKDSENANLVKAYDFLAQMISSEVLIFPEPHCDYINMNLRNFVYDHRQKTAYMQALKTMLTEHQVNPADITEVYHSSRVFHRYLKYLNPGIKLVSFEHGLSEIKNFILLRKPQRRLKHAVKTIVGRIFFQFYAYAESDDARVSLLADVIRKINRSSPIETLKNESVRNVAQVFANQDIRIEKLPMDKKAKAVIMLHNVRRYTDKKEDHEAFYKSFADYLLPKIKEYAQNTQCLIFKPRGFDKNFQGVKSYYRDRFRDYEVVFFDELSRTNGPIEYYLDRLQPQSLWGNTSSGLFYAKAINPQIKTFTFHPFVIKYLQEKFNDIFPDYHWTLDIFYNRCKDVFTPILPRIVN